MPYRVGVMPRGDMARGGFFGNVFRAVTGTLGGAVSGFIKGGPVGGIVGAIGGAAGATVANVHSDATEQVGGSDAGTPHAVALHQSTIVAKQIARARGGAHTLPPSHTMMPAVPQITAGGALVHGGGGMGGRRHRRIRWTNPKALGRAERRIHMAVKHMTRYIKWVHPQKKGKAFPHFGRKKRGR